MKHYTLLYTVLAIDTNNPEESDFRRKIDTVSLNTKEINLQSVPENLHCEEKRPGSTPDLFYLEAID